MVTMGRQVIDHGDKNIIGIIFFFFFFWQGNGKHNQARLNGSSILALVPILLASPVAFVAMVSHT